jgi:addiction module HigA family antidote
MIKKLKNIHPGEVILKEFLLPLNISQNKLAREINVPPRRINEICLGKRAISIDTAIRLGKYFNIEAEFWLNLQNMYDMEEALQRQPDVYSQIRACENLLWDNNKKAAS